MATSLKIEAGGTVKVGISDIDVLDVLDIRGIVCRVNGHWVRIGIATQQRVVVVDSYSPHFGVLFEIGDMAIRKTTVTLLLEVPADEFDGQHGMPSL